jgi:PTS system nitrogen regulatory IIA component
MKVSDLLGKKSVILELMATSKVEVLEELAVAVAAEAGSLDPNHLLDALRERERLGSTGIGDGVAIPHGKVQGLDRMVISFGRSTRGVEFDSMDKKPAHIFFLLVAPENSAGIHLRVLAKLAKALKRESFRTRLMEAGSEEEIFDIIDKEGG